MKFEETLSWLTNGQQRVLLCNAITQPITADHLSRKTGVSMDATSSALREMTDYGILHCLNPEFRTSRLYWFTLLGIRCHKKLSKDNGLVPIEYNLPDVDWRLYGWTCYRHRSAVLKVLKMPLRPADIKRFIYRQFPGVNISANNVRDIIKLFEQRGVVQRITIRRKKHPYFVLTEIGEKLQKLHTEVERPRAKL